MREGLAHALRALLYSAGAAWWAFLATVTLSFFPPLVVPLFALMGIQLWAALIEAGRAAETWHEADTEFD